MPNDAQQTIVNSFNDAARGLSSGGSLSSLVGGLLTSGGQSLPEALTQATLVITAQTQATSANTEALGVNTTTRESSAGSTAANIVSGVSHFLGGGLSLMPLVGIFSSLFGGGQPQQPPPLIPYSMPPALNFEATTNYQNIAYGDSGLPRAPGGQAIPHAATAPQITVQVQALDSQSFLDHSNDIAQAVRQAMLNMNSINDVVTDL